MKAVEAKFLKFLNDAPQFIIPIYQRTYSWDEKQCQQLWDDILNATVETGKWNIIENGGYYEGGVFYIPYQTPTSLPLEQTIWEE